MNSYVARQPILDKNLKIFAYELLFRSSEKINSYTGVDADQASLHTVIEGFYTIGLENITGNKPAFINFTESLLTGNAATLFSKDLLVVEVLEDVWPTEEIVEACRGLREKGYVIALDDFVYRPQLQPLIELASIIKFDFMASTPREIFEMLRVMDVTGKRLLAEKIETQNMFYVALEMGFTLFQGYFFSKPVTLSAKQFTPLKMNYMSLLVEIREGDDMDYGRIAAIIRRDVALCHKLLRMINSVYYGMRSTVTDIKQALALIGTQEIRKWIYFMSLMDMGSDKPDELIRMSLIRALFLEKLPAISRVKYTRDNLFLLGMFSLIDLLMDQTMKSALGGLELDHELSEALIDQSGKLYDLLRLVISFETGDWDEIDCLATTFDIDRQSMSDAYLQSVKMCNETLD